MSYYIAATLPVPFERGIELAEEALKEQGFGIISRIDMKEALKTKIGVDFRPYTILGACNPSLAHEALTAEPQLGTLLPCNVVVFEHDGETEISAIDAERMLSIVGNDDLAPIAAQVRDKLARVVERAAQPSAEG